MSALHQLRRFQPDKRGLSNVDLRRLLRTLLEQKWIVAITLLATAAAIVFVASSAEDQYQSSVSVLALRPAFVESDGEFVNINPLLSDGRNVSLTSSALIDIVNSPNFAIRADDAGVESSYSVQFNPSGGGALLSMSATGETPNGVVDDLQIVFDLAAEELDLLQERAGVTPELRINLRVSGPPNPPTPLFASKARVVLATAALGIGLAVNLAFVFASLKRRGAESKPRRRPPSDPVSVLDDQLMGGEFEISEIDDPRVSAARGTGNAARRERNP